MKVLGINGSARCDGNTAIMINKAFDELNAAGIETELVQLGGCVIPVSYTHLRAHETGT